MANTLKKSKMTIPEKKLACERELERGDRVMVEWNNPEYDERECICGKFYRVVHRYNGVIVEVGDRWVEPTTDKYGKYTAEIPLKIVTRIQRLTAGSGSQVV